MMEDMVEATEMVVEQVSGEAETLAMVEDMAQAWVAREAGVVSKVDREAGVKEVELSPGEGLRVEVEAPGVMQVCNIQSFKFMTLLQTTFRRKRRWPWWWKDERTRWNGWWKGTGCPQTGTLLTKHIKLLTNHEILIQQINYILHENH